MIGRRFPGSLTYIEQCAYEVQWYDKNGKHPDRIKTDYRGHRYVTSDLVWNRRYPQWIEHVKIPLADYIAFKITGIKK